MKQDEAEKLKEGRFQLFSRLKLKNIFPGEWKSIYKGDGIEFAGERPYEPGDNPRNIDFLTMVQSGEEFIVERVETRQLRVYVWTDFSGSMQSFKMMLFHQKPLIRDIAVGLILFSAVKVYSPIGFYPFGLAKKKFFPPRMGEGYCQEIIKWVSDEENLRPYTSSGVEQALMSLMQLAQPRNMVFFISDFKQKIFESDFTGLLKKTASKFDFVPVIIRDPLEKKGELKFSTRIRVKSSSERGKVEEIHLTPDVLREMQDISRKHILYLESNFKKIGIEPVVLDSASVDECCRIFSSFFQARKRTRR